MNNSDAVAMATCLQSTKCDSQSNERCLHTCLIAKASARLYITGQRALVRPEQNVENCEIFAVRVCKAFRDRAMRIFVSFKNESDDVEPIYVEEDCTVLQLKQMVRQRLKLRATLVPCVDDENPTRSLLSVSYYGGELADHFRLVDVGVSHGSILKCSQKEERDAILYIHCAYNDEVTRLTDQLKLRNLKVGDLKSVVSRKIGLPYSAFRLTTKAGVEMFPSTMLIDHGVQIGDTVIVETWDGFNDLLNLAIMGFTEQALNTVATNDDALARYQMKTLLYIAAHYGHVDLASACIRQGLKADEPVHEHPSRQWSKAEFHPDILKCPVHVSAEAGSLSVLRYFVLHDICVIMKNDGSGAKPLNLVLRNRRTECVKFLLTRQWTRITYANTRVTLTLNLYNRMKKWANRARERVFVIHGAAKSSFNSKRKLILNEPRVGQDVYIKGHHDSRLNSRDREPAAPLRPEVRTPEVVRLMRARNRLPPLTSSEPALSELNGNVHLEALRDNQSNLTASHTPNPQTALSRRASVWSSAISAGQLSKSAHRKNHYNVKAKETGFLLPLNPLPDTQRPFYSVVPHKVNFADAAMLQFQREMGTSTRDLAIRCLTVAAEFKDKSWIKRVRIALDMTKQLARQRAAASFNDSAEDTDAAKVRKPESALQLSERPHSAD